MAPTAVNRVVHSARRVALGQDGVGLTDGALLEAFVQARDEAAFAALVRRHGPMVLGVCRRVLRNEADAEDAFQATFLILARKAASIRSAAAVSNWLYGVAHTTSIRAQAMIRKRRTREREAAALPKTQACEEVWRAVQTLLDAELAALPDKYRTVIVLCALEGKTIQEAARQLGWPQGTVASRLSRGRTMLARRLTKHGLVVSAGALATALTHGALAAQVPPMLASSTVKAGSLLAAGQAAAGLVSAHVTALTQGVLQAMFLSKLKVCIAGVVVLAMLGAGTASVGRATSAGEAFAGQDNAPPAKQIQQPADPARLKEEIARLRLELARTQAELKLTQRELALIKEQAAVARERAEQDRRRVETQAEAERARKQAVERARDAQSQDAGQPGAKEPAPVPAVTASSPDGRIVVRSHGATVVAIDVQTGKELFKSIDHKTPVQALAFSPDGKQLIGGSQEKIVRVWDVATGKLIREIDGPGRVLHLRFSDDGRIIIIGDTNWTVREVDAATGKELRVFREPQKK